MAHWDRVTDIVVVGFGAAGAVAAIEAHDAGAKVVILEKMADPGGLSAISAGGIRVCFDVEECYRYLLATSGGRTPDNIMRALAEGMAIIPDYVRKLAQISGARSPVSRPSTAPPNAAPSSASRTAPNSSRCWRTTSSPAAFRSSTKRRRNGCCVTERRNRRPCRDQRRSPAGKNPRAQGCDPELRGL